MSAEGEALSAVTAAETPYGENDSPFKARTIAWAECGREGVGLIQRERLWIAYTCGGKVLFLADVRQASGAIPEGATGETAGLITRLRKLEESVQELRRKVER